MSKSTAALSMVLILGIIVSFFIKTETFGDRCTAIVSTVFSQQLSQDYEELRRSVDAPAHLPFFPQFDEKYDIRDFEAEISTSIVSGYYSKAQKLYFDCAYDEIRYTTDGTLPGADSLLYDASKGIDINENTFLCVSAVNNGKFSDVRFYSYVILKDATDYHYAYGYNSLDNDEKYIYTKIYEAAKNFKPTINFGSQNLTNSKIQKILFCVNYDNPLMFQLPLVSLNCVGSNDNITALTLGFDFKENDVKYYEKKTKERVEKILEKADGSYSLMDYLVTVHNEILYNCKYSDTMDKTGDYEAFGVLIDKVGVCESYSRAFQYICQRIGVENLLVVGDSQGIGHMWNMISLDNDWYHMDLTWNDGTGSKEIYYDYFNFNDAMIKKENTRSVYPMIDDKDTSRKLYTEFNYYPIPESEGEYYIFENYYSQESYY